MAEDCFLSGVVIGQVVHFIHFLEHLLQLRYHYTLLFSIFLYSSLLKKRGELGFEEWIGVVVKIW